MRIVCLSDTHDSFRDFFVPDGDLLLHAGDLSRRGTRQEVTASADWLRSQSHPHKVNGKN
ncbi:metallophosphoesterase [bacterium]|nr:metallophosphoesterase [bacterium]